MEEELKSQEKELTEDINSLNKKVRITHKLHCCRLMVVSDKIP